MIQNLRNNQNQGAPLAVVDQAQLKSLSQQGNMSYEQMVEQQGAQRAMMNALESSEENLEIPKVNFYPSRHHDPKKARKKDIRQAYKLLRPTKRSLIDPRRWGWGNYRYNKDSADCVIDGCNVMELIQHDNLYARITDEETGKSLWDLYWKNPVTGEPEAFIAREGVTSGRKMRGTYCPEHLHLYHLLCKWEAEEERENEMRPTRFRDKVRKGVSMVSVPVAAVAPTTGPAHPLITKYEPFFADISADARKSKGITMQHYANPVTGENDITTITFDMRMFQQELLEMAQPTQAFQEVLNQQTQVIQPPPVLPEIPTEVQ